MKGSPLPPETSPAPAQEAVTDVPEDQPKPMPAPTAKPKPKKKKKKTS